MGVGSSVEQPPPPSAQARSNTRTRKPGQREVGFLAFGIELLGLVEGVSSGTDQAERLLALAELQPEEEMSGIQVDGLLQQLEGEHKLLVVISNPRGEPGDKPIAGRQEQRLLKTVIGPHLLARQQDIAASQPDVRGITAFLDGGVRESQRRLEVAAAAEGHGFGGEQLRVVGKALQGLVRPETGFAEFPQLDQHAHLPSPGGGVLGVEFEHLAKRTEGQLKVSRLESGPRLCEIKRLILDHGPFLVPLVCGFATELKINEAAHAYSCRRPNQRLKGLPTN